MKRPVTRRIFVFLLAIFLAAGMGLSTVHANTMSMVTMDGAVGMAMSGMSKCDDCTKSGVSKGMVACAASACAVQGITFVPLVEALDEDSVAVRYNLQSKILSGRDNVPDFYPPRTSDIG